MEETVYSDLFEIEDRHWWFVGRRNIVVDQLKKYVKKNEGQKIIDIGCGTGGNLKALSKFGCVSGVDSSLQAVELSSQRGIGTVISGNACDLPFEDNSANVVTLLDVLEHVRDERSRQGAFARGVSP